MPATGLPKMMLDLLATADSDSFEPIRRFFFEECHGGSADRFFYDLQNIGRVVYQTLWINDQMHVIGHEDVCPEGVLQFSARFVDGIRQPLTGPVFGQERILVKAGERQFVSLFWIVVGARALAISGTGDLLSNPSSGRQKLIIRVPKNPTNSRFDHASDQLPQYDANPKAVGVYSPAGASLRSSPGHPCFFSLLTPLRILSQIRHWHAFTQALGHALEGIVVLEGRVDAEVV